MITVNFRSIYRGIATYDVFGLPGIFGGTRVEHYAWTAEEYRASYERSTYNKAYYTPEVFAREIVAKAGKTFFYLTNDSQEVPAEVHAAILRDRGIVLTATKGPE